MIRAWCDAVQRWGATDEEIADSWPCDGWVAEPDRVLYRALTIDAPPAAVFRRLCQLRVAPYSYDWLDNFGRTSPRDLIPGLEDLAIGLRFATIFTLVSFEPGHQITLHTDHPVFGKVVLTYRVQADPRGSRLAVKLRVRFPRPPLGWLMRPVLPAGDLVMMRKQLHNLAELATRDEMITR